MGKATLGVGDRNTSVHRAEVRYEEGISYSAEDIEGSLWIAAGNIRHVVA